MEKYDDDDDDDEDEDEDNYEDNRRKWRSLVTDDLYKTLGYKQKWSLVVAV